MKKLLLLFFISVVVIHSQNRGNVWELNTLEINFNNSTNTTITSTTNTVSAQSSIADTEGKILLSYDGVNLYDRQGKIVKSNEKFAKAYNSVIFKKIGCNSKYYLFETKAIRTPSTGRQQAINVIPRLYYSQFEIDNNGNVKVLEEEVLYFDTQIYSGLTCYVNEEKQKVWVIVRNGNNIFSIEVNERGPEKHNSSRVAEPKIFEYFIDGVNQFLNVFNEIKVTPQGDKLITFIQNNRFVTARNEFKDEQGYIHIVDFNKNTGETGDFFSQTKIEQGDTKVRLFNPLLGGVKDGKLYVAIKTKILPFGLPPEHILYEYDLNSNDIKATEKNIFRRNRTNIFDIQEAPDNELYIAVLGQPIYTFLGKIENSNVTELLNTLTLNITDLPSFPQSYFKSDFFFKNLCFGDVTEFTSDLIETAISYEWSFGDGNTSNLEKPTHTYANAGNYTVTLRVEDINNVIHTYTNSLTIKDELTSNTLPKEVFICSNGEPIEVDAGPFETYLWSTGETTRKISIKNPGVYTVKVSNRNCCVGELKTTLIENAAPIIEDTFYDEFDNTVTITATGNEPLTYVLDSSVTQKNNIFNNLSFGEHTVEVIDVNGCKVSSNFEVNLTIPKYFSPNGDGINDVFKIPQLRGSLDFELQIFDRYRRTIKSFRNEEVLWDGTFLGEQLVSDDYWYFLNVNGQIFKGHFSKLN
ncbi:T9SS type B sorting domain-containing protein [Tenacibaculum jejuense]|uniref:PKD domain-containing protein n=1 Tax=Tenacibaculum jejuense TaxID=584609 RepID=A0A238U7F4_9FLAO|nr:T9SS type B sorting domain-containing protein [Tenacibaculum jejuense]SNR15129.1 Protein of unknown function precursor containing PKD domains and a C-terminal secretion signal [Tenacibaculum jejuense]